MAAITPQDIPLTGAAITFQAAAAGGDTFVNNGTTLIYIKNGGGGASVATFAAPGLCSQGFVHNHTVSVPAGGERVIGPFDLSRFSTPVAITYDVVTSVTIAAFHP